MLGDLAFPPMGTLFLVEGSKVLQERLARAHGMWILPALLMRMCARSAPRHAP